MHRINPPDMSLQNLESRIDTGIEYANLWQMHYISCSCRLWFAHTSFSFARWRSVNISPARLRPLSLGQNGTYLESSNAKYRRYAMVHLSRGCSVVVQSASATRFALSVADFLCSPLLQWSGYLGMLVDFVHKFIQMYVNVSANRILGMCLGGAT